MLPAGVRSIRVRSAISHNLTKLCFFRCHARAWAGWLVAVPVLALLAGFVHFVASLDETPTGRVPNAGGIVALTGGSERITDALDLIATGHAARMLISGVNQTTSGDEIARLTPGRRHWFDCCIDLGYDALNTVGNAVETRRWVREKGIGPSLIVVTSSYHMPRALLEMARLMPEVELVPFPVVSERVRGGIWGDQQMLRMVAVEYLKYVAASLRARVMPLPPEVPDELAGPPPGAQLVAVRP